MSNLIVLFDRSNLNPPIWPAGWEGFEYLTIFQFMQKVKEHGGIYPVIFKWSPQANSRYRYVTLCIPSFASFKQYMNILPCNQSIFTVKLKFRNTFTVDKLFAMVSEFASRLCKKNSLVTMRSSICFSKWSRINGKWSSLPRGKEGGRRGKVCHENSDCHGTRIATDLPRLGREGLKIGGREGRKEEREGLSWELRWFATVWNRGINGLEGLFWGRNWSLPPEKVSIFTYCNFKV